MVETISGTWPYRSLNRAVAQRGQSRSEEAMQKYYRCPPQKIIFDRNYYNFWLVGPITAFSSRKLRSSYPYKLLKPASDPHPCYSLRLTRLLSRRAQSWTGLHPNCLCSSKRLHLVSSE